MLGWIAIVAAAIFIVIALAAAGRFRSSSRRLLQSFSLTDDGVEIGRCCWRRNTDPVSRPHRLHRLSDEDRRAFVQVWQRVCDRFNSDPRTAVIYADLLVSDLIQDRSSRLSRQDSESGTDRQLEHKYHVVHEIAVDIQRQHFTREELSRMMGLYSQLCEAFLAERERLQQSERATRNDPEQKALSMFAIKQHLVTQRRKLKVDNSAEVATEKYCN